MSLRERKKLQTRGRLMRIALELFLERGYDKVSVAEIADAADVSKMTVFNYFGSKEDLLLGPMGDHVGDPAEVVRDRAVGESAVAALRRYYLGRIDARDPSVGLSADPFVLRVRQLIEDTPALLLGALAFQVRSEELLAEVLAEEAGDPALARLAAAQLLSVRDTLSAKNYRRLRAGDPQEEVAADARELALRAFDMVEHGLGDFATRA
jgi:AcrR family transcriptional regulator